MKVLSIDPGREKCGAAVVEFQNHKSGDDGKVLWRAILPRTTLSEDLRPIVLEHSPNFLIVGHSTGSANLSSELTAMFPSLPPEIIEESHSTLEARVLYWQAHPRRGWRRAVPLSLQTPPAAIDDFAAIVIARRFFQLKFGTKN